MPARWRRGLADARDAIAGETVVDGGRGEATMFQAGDATVIEPSPAAAVRGATALTLARTPARAGAEPGAPDGPARSHRRRRPGDQAPVGAGPRARSSSAAPPRS